MPRCLRALSFFGFVFFNCSFVLLSSKVAKLPVSSDNPKIEFEWDGSAPTIQKKEEFPIRLTGQTNREVMKEIMTYAFSKWNEIPGAYIELELVEQDDVAIDSGDNINAIRSKSNSNIATAAYANPQINDDEVIDDCDIVISNKSVNAKDLGHTLIHELGHCLGLGHNHANYGAIMGYSRTTSQLSLGPDDIAGAIYLYPDPGYDDKPHDFAQCGAMPSRSDRGGPSTPATWLLLTTPLLFALLARRKRFAAI